MNSIKKLFSPRRDIVADAYERTAEKLVPVLSRGNPRLQLGKYATRSDIDAMRNKGIARHFAKTGMRISAECEKFKAKTAKECIHEL